jgi:hypothetical protein
MRAVKDIAWVAGFLEGEAWFGCVGKRSIVVKAAQVNREPLDRLHRIFGGRLTGPFQRQANHSPYFHWAACGIRAAEIMMTIYVLLSEKRRAQVRRALELWKQAKGPHKYRAACRNGHPYDAANTRLVTRAGRAKKTRGCRTCQRDGQHRYQERKVISLAQ